jgi:hypothetical protein
MGGEEPSHVAEVRSGDAVDRGRALVRAPPPLRVAAGEVAGRGVLEAGHVVHRKRNEASGSSRSWQARQSVRVVGVQHRVGVVVVDVPRDVDRRVEEVA